MTLLLMTQPNSVTPFKMHTQLSAGDMPSETIDRPHLHGQDSSELAAMVPENRQCNPSTQIGSQLFIGITSNVTNLQQP